MDRIKNILILILLLFSTSILKAEYKSEIYNAYVNNRMEQWKNVIDRMESLKGKTNEMTLELINYQYGYIGYCLESGKTDEAKSYFTLASNNLEKLEKTGYMISILNAYKSGFYGFRILFNKLSAPFNGPKSLDYAKKALAQDSLNYFINIQYGNAMSNMPAAFGGSKKKALEYYLRAKSLIEKNPDNAKYNWNYMYLLILIGQTNTSLENYSAAKAVYENILSGEPDFKYVKNELYPQLLEKMKKQN
jgi:tetratricopeptide (TPR) repeat protein